MIPDESVQGRRPGLLVSVRSAAEAIEALAGGANWIDVKEPSRGPLGMADLEAWSRIRAVVPRSIPFSAALGELADWPVDQPLPDLADECTAVKIGLARAPEDWRDRWERLRKPGICWVAVAYSDWRSVDGVDPSEVLDRAIAHRDIVGLMIDTADKSRATRLDPAIVADFRDRLRSAGKFLAMAGGLDAGAIHDWNDRIGPDWFAVRGAACRGGDRLGPVERGRVRALLERKGPGG